jgi:hypothetical protein
MRRKWKVNCPSAAHKDYEKFLVALELSGFRILKLWLHCDDPACRRWFSMTVGRRGGITVTQMPAKYHLDLTKIPVVVDCHE